MNTSQSPCNDVALLDLINDRLTHTHLETVLTHVEECGRCRTRMEDISAESRLWQKTIRAVSESMLDYGQFQSSRNLYSSVTLQQSTSSEVLVHKPNDKEQFAKKLLSPPSHPEMLGRLGRYEVEKLIGSGGMGVVFKAFDTELNRPVAIKILAPHLACCGSARQRFAREARAAAAVVNEHVVPIHNVETEGETPFLVMKYIDGESLQTRLDREGPLEVEEILRIGMQVAAGLAAAHEQGLVHRDIKPANILLEQGLERALITDFGLARAVDDANLTNSGFYVGTPQFMSPEQAAGHTVDCSSDLFSLGSVIYMLCTGRPPFRAENSFAVMKRIAEDTPRPMLQWNPRIPLWLECIVVKLLDKRPDQRLHSAALASQIFAQCLKHVQNPSGGRLPDIVLAWVNETTTVRLHGAARGRLSSRIYFVRNCFRSPRLAALLLVPLVSISLLKLMLYVSDKGQGTSSIGSWTPLSDPTTHNAPSSATKKEINETLDPDLGWDTGKRAVRILQLEADILESRLKQDLLP